MVAKMKQKKQARAVEWESMYVLATNSLMYTCYHEAKVRTIIKKMKKQMDKKSEQKEIKEKKESHHKHVLELMGATLEKFEPGVFKMKKFVFGVTKPGEFTVHLYAADSADDYDAWISAVSREIIDPHGPAILGALGNWNCFQMNSIYVF